jgi:predicted KAP-like P-loop ATPase
MRLFPPPLEIGDEEGFTPEKDIFGRAQRGVGLTNLVSLVSDPTVTAVDGQWGSGKTTFLKMWAGELRKAGFPVVYFDAFENDHVDDAFLAIAGEVIALAQKRKKANSSKGKALVKSAVGAGKVLLRSSLKLGVKAATLGAIAGADLEGLSDDIAAELEGLTDKYLGELLTQQKQQKDAIQGFRDALTELPALLSEKPNESGSNAPALKPLVFIIDELDRCRPTFALEILERIKHFFSVPNVHFVLGVHLDQLRNSVVVAYGPSIDAQTYLQKFVHLTFFLVDQGRYRSERVVPKFVAYLRKVLDFKKEDNDTVDGATELIQYVAETQDVSLRAIERIMTNLAVGLAYSPSNVIRPSPILGGLCILKVVRSDLYAKAKKGQLKYHDLKDVFGF